MVVLLNVIKNIDIYNVYDIMCILYFEVSE